MKRKTPLILVVMMLLSGAAAYYPRTNALAQGEGLTGRTITGTVYFMSGRRPGTSLPFTLRINRITTADEVRQLNSALAAGNQDELLRELSRLDAGRIQIGTGVGVPANAIMVDNQGNGRTKITVIYQRDIRFGELRRGARSTNYPFGYAELYVGRGENEGMLIPAAHVRLRDGNTWEVEDFGTFPARLMGLRVRGSGRVG
ncbi:MAG TPA: hypothetical protein VJT69_04000 [Pyrinomonadaceae bacterium]|nr:hypothetical protein [Pyrinomonadaceae bacterium]